MFWVTLNIILTRALKIWISISEFLKALFWALQSFGSETFVTIIITYLKHQGTLILNIMNFLSSKMSSNLLISHVFLNLKISRLLKKLANSFEQNVILKIKKIWSSFKCLQCNFCTNTQFSLMENRFSQFVWFFFLESKNS